MPVLAPGLGLSAVIAYRWGIALGTGAPLAGAYDTQLETSLSHGLIFLPAMLVAAALWVWWLRGRARGFAGVALLLGAAALLSVAVSILARLGLTGLPRRYADYPDAFSRDMLALAICAGVAALLLALALIFARLGRQRA